MATVYSLVCWGGRTGTTVTMTIASPCVVTTTLKSNHGLRDGTGIVFETTGALPTGVTAGTTYYTRYVAANTFHLYDTEAHAKDTGSTTGRVNTSGTQSGTHTAKSKKMLDYFDQYPGRWGDAGSERCYDGLTAWNSGRSGASPLDTEVCELLEAYDDRVTAALTISVPAAACLITSKVNGARSEAWHGGAIGAGYVFYQALNSASLITVSSLRTTTDGFTIKVGSGWYGSGLLTFSGFLGSPLNMIVLGPGGITTVGGWGVGISVIGGTMCLNNLVAGCLNGIRLVTYAVGLTIGNNFVTKCGTGFGATASTNVQGNLYNNISIGNTTNWQSVTGTYAATNNAGLSGEAWMQGTGSSRLTISTDDFVGYAGGDYRPALVTSPQVDTGSAYYGMLDRDIAGNEAPNYNNGGAEVIDVGCYEFDHGYGNHPITASLTLTGLASGTDVVVRAAGTSTILDSVDSTSGSWSYTYGSAHNVDIDVIKPGMVIVTFRNLALTAESSILPVSQQFDRNYS